MFCWPTQLNGGWLSWFLSVVFLLSVIFLLSVQRRAVCMRHGVKDVPILSDHQFTVALVTLISFSQALLV